MPTSKKRATPESLKELLKYYDKEVSDFLVRHSDFTFTVRICIDKEFINTCRKRIIKSHKKYGDDWKRKNCLKEARYEEYDLFNYPILDKCQREYRRRTHLKSAIVRK